MYLFCVCVLYLQSARAEQQQLAAQFENDIEVAKAHRDFDLKKAAYDREVNAKQAESELSFALQVSIVTDKLVLLTLMMA